MGLLSFIKGAGERLLGIGNAKAADSTEIAQSSSQNIEAYIRKQNLDAENLQVSFDPESAIVTVSGQAADQETREKIVLCCGNVAGVDKVNDQLTVAQAAEESTFHTVVSGDTLSKIAKVAYGDAMKYPVIFEANRPMLSNPDKIYPGQVLRIPPLSSS